MCVGVGVGGWVTGSGSFGWVCGCVRELFLGPFANFPHPIGKHNYDVGHAPPSSFLYAPCDHHIFLTCGMHMFRRPRSMMNMSSQVFFEAATDEDELLGGEHKAAL